MHVCLVLLIPYTLAVVIRRVSTYIFREYCFFNLGCCLANTSCSPFIVAKSFTDYTSLSLSLTCSHYIHTYWHTQSSSNTHTYIDTSSTPTFVHWHIVITFIYATLTHCQHTHLHIDWHTVIFSLYYFYFSSLKWWWMSSKRAISIPTTHSLLCTNTTKQ